MGKNSFLMSLEWDGDDRDKSNSVKSQLLLLIAPHLLPVIGTICLQEPVRSQTFIDFCLV